MAKTRIQIAKTDIVKLFDNSPSQVYRRAQLGESLKRYRDFWRLAQSTTVDTFIRFLCDESSMHAVRFDFPSRTEIRYVWKTAPLLAVVQSLKAGSYFTHYTAMSLHDLTDQLPKTVYLNAEQPPKRWPAGELQHTRIAHAFRRPPRVSKNIAPYRGLRISLLNGKFTGRLGVVGIKGPDGEQIDTTDLERTLVDIIVRPFYSGGVGEVLRAFARAAPKASVNKLATILKQLDYTYPYHQAVGFCLERTGAFTNEDLRPFLDWEKQYDFYLAHQMTDPDYSEKWRLFFPKGL